MPEPPLGAAPTKPWSGSRPRRERRRSSGRAKLERKAVDAIVFNDVSRSEIGFESADNEVTIVERAGEYHVPLATKDEVAEAILDRVEAIRSEVESAT